MHIQLSFHPQLFYVQYDALRHPRPFSAWTSLCVLRVQQPDCPAYCPGDRHLVGGVEHSSASRVRNRPSFSGFLILASLSWLLVQVHGPRADIIHPTHSWKDPMGPAVYLLYYTAGRREARVRRALPQAPDIQDRFLLKIMLYNMSAGLSQSAWQF
jgi:hypothetical protein